MRVPALDGIRGAAILMVMGYHFMSVIGFAHAIGRSILWVGHQGWIGVELFFVLSGYLITGILWDAREVRPGRYFLGFYARRILRIFPLYYASIAFILLLGSAIPALRTPGFSKFLHDQTWLWLYGVNFGDALKGPGNFRYEWFDFSHFWTLAIEEQFYLVWPLIVRRMGRRPFMGLCLGIIAVSLALRAGWLPIPHPWDSLLMTSVGRSSSLAIGALIAVARRGSVALYYQAKIARTISIIATCAYLALVLYGFGRADYVMQVYGTLILGLSFGGLIAAIVNDGSGVASRSFSHPALNFFGKYSYGLYVFHHLLNPTFMSINYRSWLRSYTLSALAFLVVSSLITLAIALLSWHLFENRIVQIKKYFNYKAII